MLHGEFASWPTIHQQIGFIGERSMPVGGVTSNQVVIVEDSSQQLEVKLQEAGQAASICLLVDQSSSMKKNANVLMDAARQIIAAANPGDEFAVVTFDRDARLEQDFTTDRDKLEAGLRRVGFGGGSAFFDAVSASIDLLAARVPERRKVLVIFSDGDDNYSHISSFGDLSHKLKFPGAPLIDSLSPPLSQSAALINLQTLSEQTGGFVYIPKHLDSWTDTAVEISRDINSRYSLEYTSTHSQRDGKLHKVEIRVAPGVSAAKIKPYFRQEYYAPSH
jgi:Ca-activated chloride channel family protein